jgi:hypothetical protein
MQRSSISARISTIEKFLNQQALAIAEADNVGMPLKIVWRERSKRPSRRSWKDAVDSSMETA